MQDFITQTIAIFFVAPFVVLGIWQEGDDAFKEQHVGFSLF